MTFSLTFSSASGVASGLFEFAHGRAHDEFLDTPTRSDTLLSMLWKYVNRAS